MTTSPPARISLFVACLIPAISFSLVCWTALRQIAPSDPREAGHTNTPVIEAVPRTGSGGGRSVINSFFRSATHQALAVNTTDSPVETEADCSCGWGAMTADFVGRFTSQHACNPLLRAFVDKLPLPGQACNKTHARGGSGQYLVNPSRLDSSGSAASRDDRGSRLANDFMEFVVRFSGFRVHAGIGT